jgi:hypothetical protein
MIEVYVNTNEKLEFRVYQAGVRTQADGGISGDVDITVTDVDTGATVVPEVLAQTELETYGGEDEVVYTYILPLSSTTYNRRLKVLWEFEIDSVAGQHIDYIEIVTPYTTPDEIVQHFPEFGAGGSNEKTFDQLKEMERTVRHVIDTYCRQSFDKELDVTKSVLGKDVDSLLMPRRLMSFTDVSLEGTSISGYVEKDPDDAWRLRRDVDYDNAIKRDVNPLFYDRFFKENRVYQVTGDWGWEYPPNEVNLAARTLIAQRYCKEETYRQKWVKTARSADFRIEFWKAGDKTTGSVDADMMLNQYRIFNVVIV